MFIDPKMQVPVEDLIKGMIVQSGNDATMALAEGVGGTVERFVQLMNEQAKALGMKGTGYKNPEGLTEAGHTTTARDLSILATRLMQDFPGVHAYYATKKYRYPGTPAASNDSNRNLLLFRDPSVDGLKTGHTGRRLAWLPPPRDFPNVGQRPAVHRAGHGQRECRANESQKLLNWGYTAFEAVKLFDANPRGHAAVWKGKRRAVKLGRPSHRGGGARRQRRPGQDTRWRAPTPGGPVRQGPGHRHAKVVLGDQPIARSPLVALEAVEQAGLPGPCPGTPSASGSNKARSERSESCTLPRSGSQAWQKLRPHFPQAFRTNGLYCLNQRLSRPFQEGDSRFLFQDV